MQTSSFVSLRLLYYQCLRYKLHHKNMSSQIIFGQELSAARIKARLQIGRIHRHLIAKINQAVLFFLNLPQTSLIPDAVKNIPWICLWGKAQFPFRKLLLLFMYCPEIPLTPSRTELGFVFDFSRRWRPECLWRYSRSNFMISFSVLSCPAQSSSVCSL